MSRVGVLPPPIWVALLTTLLSISIGGVIGSGLDLSLKRTETAAGIAAIVFGIGLWLGYLALRADLRRIDFFAPEVIFVALYLLSSFGQVLLVAIDQDVFLPHLYLPALPIYLLVVLLGLFGLLIGFSIPSNPSAKRIRMVCQERGESCLQMARLYTISFAFLVIANIAFVIGFLSDPIVMSGDYFYGLEQYTYGFAYYTKLAASFVILPSFTLAAYTENRLNRRRLWWLVMLPYVLMNLSIGARGGLIPLITLGLIARNYGHKRVSGRTIIVWAIVLAAAVVLLAVGRSGGALGVRHIVGAGFSNLGQTDWLRIVLVDVGVPASITTSIIRWFPNTINWLYGQSFVSALLNMVPGFLFGGSLNRPFLTMAFLFKDLLEGGQFNPNIGYGFAILAEAYANFGIAGSFVVMMVIGLVLKWLYNAIFRTEGTVRAVIVACYGVALTSAILTLRGEFLSFIKPTLYGVFISTAIHWVARFQMQHWAKTDRRTGAPS